MYLHPKYDTQNKQIRFDSAPIANNHVYGYSLLEQQTIICSAIICKLLLCLSCLCAFAKNHNRRRIMHRAILYFSIIGKFSNLRAKEIAVYF